MSHVIAFTGHMIDKPGRPTPRFPAQAEPEVAERISDALNRMQATIGYASAACGGDLLFHEAMLRRGGEIHIVLPCPLDEFRQACVDIVPNGRWGNRLEKVLDQATSIDILSDQCASDNAVASECCNQVILGLAVMEAAANNARLSVLALWDGQPGDAIGGTHSMVDYCQRHNRLVHVIDAPVADGPNYFKELGSIPDEVSSVTRLPGSKSDPAQQICAMVFADAANFSKLKERQLPSFARNYLGEVKRILEQVENVPLVRNTWGDGLFVVFSNVRDAGNFALELRDFVCSTKWENHGLPVDFNIRIGLHAGPVYRIYDPIIGQWSYIGSHLTQAARLEPSAPIGGVYASRTFAALAAAEDVREFKCEYIGIIDLVKGYGILPTYRVDRIGN